MQHDVSEAGSAFVFRQETPKLVDHLHRVKGSTRLGASSLNTEIEPAPETSCLVKNYTKYNVQ
jgi:hypothetical protein